MDKNKIISFITKKTDNSYFQFVKYFFASGIALVVDMGMLFVLTEYCHLYYLLSSTISFLLGIFITYLFSKLYIFNKTSVKSKTMEFSIFLLIGLIGLLLNNLFLYVLTEYFDVYYMFSKCIVVIITYLWNFFARKKFIFS
ncbi:MAG: GtrA family protein [Endomicrobiaceae bacterium]|nr:GtrA family protein [Endomicrobiaceae bacterium]